MLDSSKIPAPGPHYVTAARCLHQSSGADRPVETVAPPHLALFYADDDAYVDGVMEFLRPGLAAGEPVGVAVPRPRAELLREKLGSAGPDLEILDMLELGRNPARIIPAVLSMLERHRGRRLHYVGEPVWPGRSREEYQEVSRHEALINLAWPGAAIRVLCPYDTVRLAHEVLYDAERTHAWIVQAGRTSTSRAYGGSEFPAGTDDPLPEPPADAAYLRFGLGDLGLVRALVNHQAVIAGLVERRAADLVLAVNEVATNAIKYARAAGELRVWRTARSLICQLDDRGHIADPLAGRHRPVVGTEGGLGLWMVNQLCDLVEVRTTAAGTTIRLSADLP